MLRHVVLFKWKPETTAEQLQAVADGLAILPSHIPEIRRYEFGEDLGLSDATFDFGLVADFDDEAGYRSYSADAEHQRVLAEHIRPIVDRVVRVQFLV